MKKMFIKPLFQFLNAIFNDLRLGNTIYDKIKLIAITQIEVAAFVVRRVSKRYLYIIKTINLLLKTVSVNINGIKYHLVDLESKAIVSSPQYEHWIWGYLKGVKKGETFVDIGAHIGKYALFVAKILGSDGLVVAFEPSPENYIALQKGIKLNCFTNVIALNNAAWNENAELKLFIGEVGGWHSLLHNWGKGYFIASAVKVDNALKSLKINKTDWIKIDVEGAELQVLEGLNETLASYHPKLFVEVAYSHIPAFEKSLEKYSYKLFACSHEANAIDYFCE